MNAFEIYSKLQDSLEEANAGFTDCTYEDNCIEFNNRHPISSWSRKISDERDKVHAVDSNASTRAPICEALFEKRCRIERNATISYTTTDAMFRYFYSQEAPTLFPSGLQLESYTWGDFHSFWKYLKSLAELHRFFLAAACTELGGNTSPYNSGVLLLDANTELSRMKHRVGLRYRPASAILQDLTYTEAARDIIHQPLILLKEGHYATAPLLIYGSNHERNFLLTVDNLSTASSQAINSIKEHLMLEELEPLFSAQGLITRQRLRLGTPPYVAGDIDLLVYDRGSTIAMAISLKWFFGPDSVYEVQRHDEKFSEALNIHKRCLHELELSKINLSRNFNLQPPLGRNTKIVGIIVSKMARPSVLVEDSAIPIVTSDDLKASIKDDDLSALYQALMKLPEALPVLRGKESHRERLFGDCRVRFLQFIPE
ncbi:MAG: hypothetical protein ABJC13_02105 [Acidobacteriota bacterium]